MQQSVRYYSFLEPSGYGLAAIAYIEALLEQSVQVYWTPFVNTGNGYKPWTRVKNAQLCTEENVAKCVRDPERARVLIQCLKPVESYQCIVLHTVPEYWPGLIEPDGVHIGYTVWETTRLPEHFPDLINLLDKVLVPSKFNVPIFKDSGVTVPIEVVPHILGRLDQESGVDLSKQQVNPVEAKSRFVFYSINTWTTRKAMWTLVHCYLQAFTADDQVELRLKTSLYGPTDEYDIQLHRTDELVDEICAQYQNPACISMIRETIEPHEIETLHHQGDCFVSAAHSEGWGLGAFEAAAHGNPVIMTGWGGQLDYLSGTQSNLVRYSMISVRDMLGHSYTDDQKWAKIDETHLIEKMREVYVDYAQTQIRAEVLAIRLRQDYSSQTIGKKLHKALFNL